jgi:hypothetical protein
VRLTHAELLELDRFCAEKNLTRSQVIRKSELPPCRSVVGKSLKLIAIRTEGLGDNLGGNYGFLRTSEGISWPYRANVAHARRQGFMARPTKHRPWLHRPQPQSHRRVHGSIAKTGEDVVGAIKYPRSNSGPKAAAKGKETFMFVLSVEHVEH